MVSLFIYGIRAFAYKRSAYKRSAYGNTYILIALMKLLYCIYGLLEKRKVKMKIYNTQYNMAIICGSSKIQANRRHQYQLHLRSYICVFHAIWKYVQPRDGAMQLRNPGNAYQS